MRNTYTLITILVLIKCNLAKNISFDIGEGEYAEIIHFPHVVNLNKVCGASILNQQILLTTANCICKSFGCDIVSLDEIVVFTGHANREEGKTTEVLDFKMHEKYQPHEFMNNIALLILEEELQLGKTRQRVILQKNPPMEEAEIAGWGAINEEEFFQSHWLKSIKQRVLLRETCIAKLCQIPPGTFCARHPGGFLLNGDSGSPLVVRKNIQIGIASHMVRKKSRKIAVYTNVTQFLRWIKKASTELYCRINHE